MLVSVIICAVTCVVMILGVLFFPKLKLGKVTLDSYWIVTLIGASVLLISGQTNLAALGGALVADNAINPLKLLVLFLSMTILSVFLDELGFFRYLASVTLKRAKTGQMKLFLYLYIMVSVLTVFTSNDVIILSFTPFICYFAKHAKVDAIPYLAAEFVAANTWSMAFVIGNPTNIYLATDYGIDFVSYVEVSILPTLAAGIVAFGCLLLLFRKKLKAPIEGEAEELHVSDKLLLGIGLTHLGACTLLLAVGSYIGLEMWYISLAAVGSLFVCSLIVALVRREKPLALGGCLRRAPYQLVPFILSMFVMVVTLSEKGVTAALGELLGTDYAVLKYGAASFLTANLINNIPMSVFFAAILETLPAGTALPAVYATIVGSNLGAFLTPIGALAGIMWSSILHKNGLKFGYHDFLKIGVCVAVPALAAALGVLSLVMLI